MALFKKAACFTDLHVGLKSNSITHLTDCEEFIDWFICGAKKQGCETCIFLGDWSHNRSHMNLVSLDASVRYLEKLGAAFDQFFWFPGNHDLFYKDRRDIHSTIFGKHIPGVTVVDKITTIDEVTLVPWLVNDEWKKLKTIKSRYVFGHLELPLFFMNAMVQMPDQGTLKALDLAGPEYVFSGHFHKRQNQGNIHYIGNAFPHNYSDTWDDDRGMMILEWGGKPTFLNWDNAPKYRTIKLSNLIDKEKDVMKSKMHLRVNLDIDLSFEEANFIKEKFVGDYDIRDISLIQNKENLDGIADEVDEPRYESVDQIITKQILNIDSDQFDKNVVLDIYNNL